MARIIYDYDRPTYYDSAGYNRSRFNGSNALIAIVILFVLFYLANQPWSRGYRSSTTQPVEASTINSIPEIRYVTADNLFMREQPGYDAQVRYILPRGTKVMLLGASHLGLDGEVWLRARVETVEGTYDGWVSERYV
jgi:hypothetical protein